MKPYFERGNVTLYCGDSREVLPQLDPVDVVFTSPPYGNQRNYDTGVGAEKWDDLVPPVIARTPAHADTQIIVNLGLYHLGGHVVRYWDALIDVMEQSDYRLFGWYVWNQRQGLPGDWNGRFSPSHEWLFHFNKDAVTINKTVPCKDAGQMTSSPGLRKKDGVANSMHQFQIQSHKIPSSVVSVHRDYRSKEHPAVFPEELPERVIAAFPGETVLDPFAGSGTTLVAARELGRKAIGVEISERYCEIIAKRLEQNVFDFQDA